MRNETPQHLTPFDYRLYAFLVGTKQFYRSRKALQLDGSFFLANTKIQKEMKISRRWLIYSKRRIQKAGLIRFQTYHGPGKATTYWVLSEPIKKEKAKPISSEPIFQGTKQR